LKSIILLLGLLLGACERPSQLPTTDTDGQETPNPEVDSAENDIPVSPFESAKVCAECHPVQYSEWRESMHAYAAQSPVFEAMAAKAYRDTAGEVGTFCTGCHSVIGDAEGDPGSVRVDARSEGALEGVTCDYCHTATGHTGLIGNTSLIAEGGPTKIGPYQSDATEGHRSVAGDFLTQA
jgi:hypothetical protein